MRRASNEQSSAPHGATSRRLEASGVRAPSARTEEPARTTPPSPLHREARRRRRAPNPTSTPGPPTSRSASHLSGRSARRDGRNIPSGVVWSFVGVEQQLSSEHLARAPRGLKIRAWQGNNTSRSPVPSSDLDVPARRGGVLLGSTRPTNAMTAVAVGVDSTTVIEDAQSALARTFKHHHDYYRLVGGETGARTYSLKVIVAAKPRSFSLRRPSGPRRTLPGFRSRCTTPRAWRSASPLHGTCDRAPSPFPALRRPGPGRP